MVIYHGVRKTGSGVIYRLGLVLLDLNNPAKVLRRSDNWIFGPQESYEREGDINDVVFPCGWVKQGHKLRLYYGATDTCIALATSNINDLLEYALSCPKPEKSTRWG